MENQKLKALEELDNTLESSALNKEIEELHQRLMEAEETTIGFEQEVAQWKTECETLQSDLQMREAELREQIVAKTKLVEQLTNKGNEHQLEISKLRAENKLLNEQLHDAQQLSHNLQCALVKTQLRTNEALLCSNLVSDSASSTSGALLMFPSLNLFSVVSNKSVAFSSEGSFEWQSLLNTTTGMKAYQSVSSTGLGLGLNTAARPFSLRYKMQPVPLTVQSISRKRIRTKPSHPTSAV